jgi:hypothetical protein
MKIPFEVGVPFSAYDPFSRTYHIIVVEKIGDVQFYNHHTAIIVPVRLTTGRYRLIDCSNDVPTQVIPLDEQVESDLAHSSMMPIIEIEEEFWRVTTFDSDRRPHQIILDAEAVA